MFGNPSLMTRIAVGKTIGFIIGLTAFFALPHLLPDAGEMLRWGLLLWYITFGAIIGVFGVITEYPVINMRLPWYFTSAWIGGWMNFVLVFFAHDEMSAMLLSIFGEGGTLISPFWFAAEGAIIGLIIGYFAKRFGGEGPETAGK